MLTVSSAAANDPALAAVMDTSSLQASMMKDVESGAIQFKDLARFRREAEAQLDDMARLLSQRGDAPTPAPAARPQGRAHVLVDDTADEVAGAVEAAVAAARGQAAADPPPPAPGSSRLPASKQTAERKQRAKKRPQDDDGDGDDVSSDDGSIDEADDGGGVADGGAGHQRQDAGTRFRLKGTLRKTDSPLSLFFQAWAEAAELLTETSDRLRRRGEIAKAQILEDMRRDGHPGDVHRAIYFLMLRMKPADATWAFKKLPRQGSLR
jgi:hypothetical protein